ncbi:MAG: hypothetical protein AAF618_00245 [Pseudomonadota bacterium]
MGIHLSVTVRGPQLADALAYEPEELAFALHAFCEHDAADLGSEVRDLAYYGTEAEIAQWLRKFADAIEGKGEEAGA